MIKVLKGIIVFINYGKFSKEVRYMKMYHDEDLQYCTDCDEHQEMCECWEK